MRRRRNQAHAGARESQARDHVVDLVARQLAALAGLGALRDLDLQHLGVDQIFRRHAEAARGHLLDLRILLGAVAHRILAAFARIGARAQRVHGGRERFVRLRRQRAQGHARAVEARENARDGLHLFDGNRRRTGLEPQKIADAGHRPLVDESREFPILIVAARHHRRLQRRDHIRVVHVVLAVVHVLEQAALLHRFGRHPRRAPPDIWNPTANPQSPRLECGCRCPRSTASRLHRPSPRSRTAARCDNWQRCRCPSWT